MRPSPGAWGEFPCIECGTRVAGLPPGERCPDCRWAREGRASRIARRLSLLAVVLYGAWVVVSRPTAPTILVALGAPVTYLVVRFVSGRITQELPQ